MPTLRSSASTSALSPLSARTMKRAEELAANPDSARALLDAARKKAERSRAAMESVWIYLLALIRMLRAYFTRSYRDVPWRTVTWGLAAVVYFVAPLDFIPDFLLGGLVDDAAVVMFVARQIQKDLDAFLEWESSGVSRESN